jgi:hypothetical protein
MLNVNDRQIRPCVSLLVVASIVAGAPSLALARSKKKAAPEPEPAAAAPAEPSPPPAAEPPPPAPVTATVTVKGDKMQITFDGRPFGAAPVTIGGIPKGDYVVEGTLPDGRVITRPITVDDSGDVTVDLGADLVTEATAVAAAQAAGDRHPRLRKASKILVGVSAGALVVGLVFGAMELKTHGDYESAPADQATLDSLARTGKREAMIANISFATCGAALLAAGLTALPIFMGSEATPATPPPVTVTATASANGAMAGLSMRF